MCGLDQINVIKDIWRLDLKDEIYCKFYCKNYLSDLYRVSNIYGKLAIIISFPVGSLIKGKPQKKGFLKREGRGGGHTPITKLLTYFN